jgi:protease IV
MRKFNGDLIMQTPLKVIDSIRRCNFVEIELQGEIVEEEERFIIPFFPRKRKLNIWDLEKIFLNVSKSPDIRGVLIKIRDLKIGLARAEAIRRGILELREKGKRVFVYLESPGNLEYMIGSAAEKIFILPWSILNLIGLKAEITFFKDALDKLGIEAEIKGLGEYKSASETFTRRSMSEPHRDMIDSIIDDLYLQFVRYISQGRGISEEKIKSLIDSGPFLPEEALKTGLVDELGYEDDLGKNIEEAMDLQIRKIRAEGFLRIIKIREMIRSLIGKIKGNPETIALVSDSGMVMLGESRGSGGTKILGSQTLIGMLRRVADDKSIKALVLRISSPGGSGVASDLIWHQLKIISEKKPVVVSMSDVAASGGYLIALGARKIVAEPMTLTGSIGIISGKFNLKNFFTKVGVTKDVVMRGSRALMFSGYKEFTKDEEEKLGEIMKSLYEDFVKKVADSRGMDFKSAEQLARGRVWTGKQAKEIGLIDELGGIKEAIQIAKKEAGISEDVSPVIKFFSKPKGIRLTSFSRSFTWRTQIESLQNFLQALKREAVLALVSFWIEVK